jgi:hypothetical protein
LISFRYHVFTIVAIFLAVALGIAVGNAYVQPALVRQLQNQTDDLRNRVRDLESQLTDSQGKYGRLLRGSDVLGVMDRGQLAGMPVIVVTEDGVDRDALTQARDALDAAKATVVAGLSITGRVSETDRTTHADLTDILGLAPSASADDVIAGLAETLARRLVAGPPRRGAQPSANDLLDELLRGQYLGFPAGFPNVGEGDLSDLGGRGELIVAVTGGEEPLALSPSSFMVPFVRAAIAEGARVAAAEPSATSEAFVETLRGTSDLDAAPLVTVDDAEFPIGGAGLVVGLERLITIGDGGDYGIKDGAEAPIPPIP